MNRPSAQTDAPRSTPPTWRELRHEWLFGSKEEVADLADDLDLAEQITRGLPARSLQIPVTVFDFRLDQVARWIEHLDLPAGSSDRLSSDKLSEWIDELEEGESKTISPEASDELASVLRVLAKTLETFADTEKAKRWLTKPNDLLRGKKPAELLDTEAGRQAVEKVLVRIGHGVFS